MTENNKIKKRKSPKIASSQARPPKQETVTESQEKQSFISKLFSKKGKQCGDSFAINSDKKIEEPIGFQKEKKRAELYLKDKTKLKGLNAVVTEKMENTKNQIREGIDDLYTLLRLVTAYAQGEYRDVSKSTMVAVVAALLYFMSPIDLLPDMLAFIGLVDDLSVLAYVMRTFKNEIDRFVKWEMVGGDVMDEGDVPDEGK